MFLNRRLVLTFGLASCWLVSLTVGDIFAQESSEQPNVESEWVQLFNGKNLEGWTLRNGTAKYTVDGDSIVGTTDNGSPNSFLCTNKLYSDFELKFEVKVHDRLNSGVQIRSKAKTGNKERVYGPQVEIESSGPKGAEAGYIYGEATGQGWLIPNDQRLPHKTFKDGQWNQYRVVARGARIQTWINGQPIADLTDETTYKSHPKGFIGLQVHSIPKNQGPYSVRWRKIMLREIK